MDGFHLPSIPPHILQPGVSKDDVDADGLVTSWLKNFRRYYSRDLSSKLSELFVDDCWWRDMVALNWDFSTTNGLLKIENRLSTSTNRLDDVQTITTGGLKSVLVDLGGMIWVQGGFTFKNGHGTGRGLVKLLNTEGTRWKAWTVFTQLEKLNFQFDDLTRRNLNPAAAARCDGFADCGYDSKHNGDPECVQVLIVGAGQAGLSLGARLSDMGIRVLLVDKHEELGGSWKCRYDTVTLNTPTYTDHPPFMKLPENWPRWLRRDRVAHFWKHYGQLMGLDCLMKTEVTKVEQQRTLRYQVSLKSDEGSTTLFARHVVLATGVFSTVPHVPKFGSEDAFGGRIYHSSEHASAGKVPDVASKKVVVVGAGTSGHDIAQDYANHGAKEVSILQRHPIFYLSAESSEAIQLGLWNMEGISTEEADLLGNAIPLAVIRTMSIGMTHLMAQIDKDMISGLEDAGLAIKKGDEGYGLADYQLIKGGHFYVDQGAGQMIVDGRIKVHRCEGGIESFQQDGLTLANGTKVDADIVVLATGYQGSVQNVERLMGKDVASKMSATFGELDEENERSGWWRPTGQPGFWYMTGSFMFCRQYSLPLALQIAAIEKGLNQTHWDSEYKGRVA